MKPGLATSCASLAALATLTSPSLAQTSTEIGPAPASGFGGTTGRVSALAPHPSDPNTLFAAGADGGVWRTSNAGASWTNLTDSMPTSSMGALAIDPAQPATIFAGTGEANFANHSRYGLGLYRSFDSGNTWSLLAPEVFAGRCFSRLLAVRDAGNLVLYAAITRAGGYPTLAAAKGHPLAAGPMGVFKSTDSGATWTHLLTGLPNLDATDLAVHPTNPSILYAAIGHHFGSPDNAVYQSTNAGASWTRLAGGFPTTSVGRIGIAISPADPARLYAFIANPADAAGNASTTRGIYRSDNAGSTWTSLSAGSLQVTYGWYFTTVACHPTQRDTVFFGALAAWRSTNAGIGLTSIGPQHPDVHAFAFDAAGRLLSGDDGGVHRSSNLGASWTHLNNTLGTVQFYAGISVDPTNPNRIYGGLQDNGSVRYSSGLSWTSLTGGDGGWTQLDQFNPLILFTESQGTGSLNRSTDGGNSFTSAGSGITGDNCFLPPYLLDLASPGRMLYATERVWRSTNFGASWTPLSPDLTAGGTAAIRALAIAPSDSRFVYAATNDHRLLASTDSGQTFSLRLTDNLGWPRVTREVVVHPYLPQTVYLCGARFGSPHLRQSTDAGLTWSNIGAALPDVPINVCALDTRHIVPLLYAGADDGVYRSLDSGATWSRFGDAFPHACVVDIVADTPRNRLVVATQGRGAWIIDTPCPVDYDSDGAVDFFDYDAFVHAFETAHFSADFNADAIVDFFDYDAFVQAFESGC